MINTYEIGNYNDYYTALQVAEILGLDKNTILNRCKRGYYLGAIKAEPTPGNPHGQWYVPKTEIDNPTMTKDVATLTRQITPLELQQAFGQAITEAVSQAIEPIQKEMEDLKQQLAEEQQRHTKEIAEYQNMMKDQNAENARRQHDLYNKFEEVIHETRRERREKEVQKPWYKFWGD